MRKAKFTLESLNNEYFSGYTNDEKWNGWACPYFSFEESARLVHVHNELLDIRSSYQQLTDHFVFEFSDGVEEYGSIFLEGQKFYQIGSGAWIWEEVQQND
jgi:hypothetical protein